MSWKSLQTGDVHREAVGKSPKIREVIMEAAGKTKVTEGVWKSLHTGDFHQEVDGKTKAFSTVVQKHDTLVKAWAL